ncbi:DUF4422 domain-containing protein [Campylobacter devanensis]|uniref:DUF4422 domain-containing protein n=1 Tax=Campylobacter devanensis TaxID=3161138 RepID=UPI000A341F72|nr:DUF4422 domain-containing protein [Campylobacter sp. P093]
MDVNNLTVKILIAYHKPAPLIKSDIFVPIHVGRSVAKEASKDGVISDEDLKWLKDNMIRDDTGNNISYLNRSFCELTAIYWAWKNYDKLENPDYIGLCHYRHFFQFYGYKYNITQICSHDLIEYVKQFRAIVPEPLFIRDPSLHTFSTYQICVI